ncbi:hypothetical protein FA13DRAFT_261835 [Coprinellus micaceus]|uniref:Uncharacterized protein n=1 Tax=Coprinellus micaceus TaxID=71717 RepID=A0A4Y7TF41_COPMI|nr:hypothetical protein FA13DRAFT_261835 [Coprinellus micaceus]
MRLGRESRLTGLWLGCSWCKWGWLRPRYDPPSSSSLSVVDFECGATAGFTGSQVTLQYSVIGRTSRLAGKRSLQFSHKSSPFDSWSCPIPAPWYRLGASHGPLCIVVWAPISINPFMSFRGNPRAAKRVSDQDGGSQDPAFSLRCLWPDAAFSMTSAVLAYQAA